VTATAHLTTGWEPDLPVEDTMLRSFVFAYADRLARVATAARGEIGGSDEAAFADPGSPFMSDNGVVLLQPPTPKRLDRVMRAAQRFFPPERTWTLLSVWPTPDLHWRGLELMGHPPVMMRAPGGAGLPSEPSGLVVSEVTSPEGLVEFEAVLVSATSVGSSGGVVAPGLLGSALRLFVGRAQGRPVAVSSAAVGAGMLEIDWVATLPEARGRGFGTAMIAAAVRTAPDLPAVQLGGDVGATIQRRLGFLPLLRATVWIRPGAVVPRARNKSS